MVDTISASELKQALDQFVIIDVREQDELTNSTIDGSTHMPLGLAIWSGYLGWTPEENCKCDCQNLSNSYLTLDFLFL